MKSKLVYVFWLGAALSFSLPSSLAREYQLSAKQIKKYNSKEALCYYFDSLETLQRVKDFYHSIQVPDFIHEFIHLAPSDDTALARRFPRSIAWNKEGTFLLQINPQHTSAEDLAANPLKRLKDLPWGFSLIGWYIHPNLVRASPFDSLEVRANLETYLSTSKSAAERTLKPAPSFQTVEEPGSPYLVSLLDVTPQHIPYLKGMKRVILENLKNTYDVTPQKDQVGLFIHFPYSKETSSLHIHVRVNQAEHPLDQAKSFSLDDIIAHLEKGTTTAEMILEKQKNSLHGCYLASLGAEYTLTGLAGVTIRHIPNPFLNFKVDSVSATVSREIETFPASDKK